MNRQPTFFDFAAEVGLTKHFGGVGATEELALLSELVAWVSQDAGATVEPLTSDAWVALMQGAGLSEIAARLHTVEAANETKELARRYGRGGVLRASLRMLGLYLRSPAYRAFVKEVGRSGIVPPSLNECFGYGVYVGRE